VEGAVVIDWRSEETHVLLNPRMPDLDRRQLEALTVEHPLPGHVWLATSGTSGALRLVALSKRALLASAGAVNRHLDSNADDVWICVLPTFHVGGLAIYARAFLSGARVVSAAWEPREFVTQCRAERVTLASLVPAQLIDLLDGAYDPPPSLRAIVVGGGALHDETYRKAREAGWPLLPSYGSTECCSQVATAKIESPELVLLDHFEARTEADGRLAFRGEALLTGYATPGEGFSDPKVGGWFVSEDLGSIEDRILRIEGRSGDFVKIGGESVDLGRLDRILAATGARDAALVALPDPRLGHVIELAIASGDAEAIVAKFNQQVLPFERIRGVRQVETIPRTALGKVIRMRLLELIR
jgi:o-succinylbenzoate---CoA ligase